MAKFNTQYSSQDRGNTNQYQKYLMAMDAVSVEKVASASVYFEPEPGNTIVDVGMGSGKSTYILALLFPKLHIIGVDVNKKMVEHAQANYSLPNLFFRVDDGEKLLTFKKDSIDGFFNCSAIHHITSFNNYETFRAYTTIKRQSELLKRNGVIVIRDFLKPPEQEVILQLYTDEDAHYLIDFSQRARSLANETERGFPLQQIEQAGDVLQFRLFYSDALEYIRRKDYKHDWDIELQEEYGYYTQAQFEDIFQSLGYRIILSSPLFNPWIIRNRYKGKFRIFDLYKNDLGIPPTNYIISGMKTSKANSRLYTLRHLPVPENSYLISASYQNKTNGEIYDMIKRPNPVVDLLPYFFDIEGELKIFAKDSYPRPLVNLDDESPELDGKNYSGYITEGISSVIKSEDFEEQIKNILEIKGCIAKENIGHIIPSLTYFPSPGGIDEIVNAYLIQLNNEVNLHTLIPKNYSGFSESGTVRPFHASQLIKTSQTGGLPDARLELNIYELFRKLKKGPGKWLADKIIIKEPNSNEIKISKVSQLKEMEASNIYEKTDETWGYLNHKRTKFAEQSTHKSSQIIEYVVPSNKSKNTIIALPVISLNSKICIGLELRELPVPQIHHSNAKIYVAPAFRLGNSVKNLSEVEKLLLEEPFFNTRILSSTKLGEKFFASQGITPEQVYPFVVELEKCTDKLTWFSLKDLYLNLKNFQDGHLLISIMRLTHALGKWEEYINEIT